MSCFLIPDGFADPNFERYQPVGGVATFMEFETGTNCCSFELFVCVVVKHFC